MDIPADLLSMFCRVTNANEVVASQLLRDSGLDLDTAIQSFFAIKELGGIPDPSDSNLDEDDVVDDVDPDLTNADHHQHHSAAAAGDAQPIDLVDSTPSSSPPPQQHQQQQRQRVPSSATATAARHTGGHETFDQPGVDFASIIADMVPRPPINLPATTFPPLPSSTATPPASSTRGNHHHHNSNTVRNPQHTRQQQASRSRNPFYTPNSPADERGQLLADMYKPPSHLNFSASLEDAFVAGERRQKWIMVNIQDNKEFESHKMNRDVWKNRTVQEIVQAHFIFWQRDVTDNHLDYARFYPVNNTPHVAVIDPRSRERVRVWGDSGTALNLVTFLDDLQDFVSGNSLDSDRVIRGGRSGSGSGSASASGSAMRNVNNSITNNNNNINMSNNARRQQQSAHELNNRGTRDREYVEQQQNQRLRDGGGEMENPARRIDATAPIPIDSVAEDAQLAAAIAASMAATDDEPRATTDGAAAPSASGSRSNSSSRPVDVDGSSVRTRDAGSSHEDIDMADVHPTWNNAIRSTSNNSDGGITSALPPLASGPSSSTTPPSTDYNNASDGNENASLQRAASRLLSATDPTLNRQRSLRAEQDDAFQESLALDRAKAASERSEHERQQREREQAERVEQERLQAREAKRRRVCDPPPKSTPAEQVTELAIRLPNGQRLQRRFFSTDRFENVYDYVEIEAPQLDGVAFDLTTFDRKKLYGDRMVQLAELPTRKAALVVHLRD